MILMGLSVEMMGSPMQGNTISILRPGRVVLCVKCALSHGGVASALMIEECRVGGVGKSTDRS